MGFGFQGFIHLFINEISSIQGMQKPQADLWTRTHGGRQPTATSLCLQLNAVQQNHRSEVKIFSIQHNHVFEV